MCFMYVFITDLRNVSNAYLPNVFSLKKSFRLFSYLLVINKLLILDIIFTYLSVATIKQNNVKKDYLYTVQSGTSGRERNRAKTPLT